MTWFEIGGYLLSVVCILFALLSKDDAQETKWIAWAILIHVSMVADRVIYQ